MNLGELKMSSDDEEGSYIEQITAGTPNKQLKKSKAKTNVADQKSEDLPPVIFPTEPPAEQVRICTQPPPTVEPLKGPDKGNDNEGDDGVTLLHAKSSVAPHKVGQEAPVTISEELVTNLGEMQMSSDDEEGSDDDQITAGIPKPQVKGLDNGVILPPKPPAAGNKAPVINPEELGETGSGTPPQVPVNKTSPPNGEEDEEDEDEDEPDPRQAEEMTVSRFLGYFFSNPLLVAFFALCVTIFAIIILSELFKFIQAVQSAPFLFQMAGVVVGSGLAIAFVWAVARLVMTYRLFVISPQVQLDEIRDPYSRAIIRKKVANKANKQVEEGYQALVTLVREYPIEDPKQIKLLRMAGMTEAEEVKFKKDIADLKDSDSAGRSKWIEDCDSLFVKKIDDFASQRVSDYSKRVGIKTALCPTGFLDALIVIVNSLLMVEELCRLYNVRANWRNSAFLAARLVFNTFISAKLEKSLDKTANFFSDELALASTSLGNALSKLFLGVGKRMVEGAFNYFLIKRLGHATMRYLRPIKLK